MARIFVSHSSKDNAKAQALYDWLRGQGHSEGFLDIDTEAGIQPGTDWERELYREVERSQAVVILLTKNWMASKWCFAEFTQARALGKKIFPVIETPVGDQLIGSDLQAIDLTSKREGGLKKLSRAISELALASAEGFELPKGISPFPGLDALGRDQAAVFFGRDDDIAALMERFRRIRTQGGTRFVPILGASGSGKSSLLRAGLLPRLALDKENWIVLDPLRPEGMPHRRLAGELARAAEPGDDATALKRRRGLREALMADLTPGSVGEAAEAIRERAGKPDAGILIAVDQLEEAFTLATPEERAAFFALLSRTLDAGLPFHVVATLRSDFLGDLQTEEEVAVDFEPYSLKPVPLERIGALVRGPARIAGLEVDDELVAAIMRDAGSAEALPLVAFCLRRLYEAQRSTGRLTLAGYDALGDAAVALNPIDNAVRQAAEEALPQKDRTSEVDSVLKSVFVEHLVQVNSEGDYVRKPAAEQDLPGAARSDIDRLVDARLLVRRPNAEDGSGPIIEVTHEALFRVWEKMAKWLEEERDFLVGRIRIGQTVIDWLGLPEDERPSGLIVGVLLERAREWLVNRPRAFSESERRLIAQSIEADDARKRAEAERRARNARLQRRVAFGAIAAALVFAVIGAFAGVQWFRAEKQTARADTSAKQAQLQSAIFASNLSRAMVENGEVDQALLLLLRSAEALQGEELPDEIRVSFQRAIDAARARTVHQIPEGSSFRKIGNSLVAIGPEGKVVYHFDGSGEPKIVWKGSARILAVSAGQSPDQLLTVEEGPTIRLVDIAKGTTVFESGVLGLLDASIDDPATVLQHTLLWVSSRFALYRHFNPQSEDAPQSIVAIDLEKRKIGQATTVFAGHSQLSAALSDGDGGGFDIFSSDGTVSIGRMLHVNGYDLSISLVGEEVKISAQTAFNFCLGSDRDNDAAAAMKPAFAEFFANVGIAYGLSCTLGKNELIVSYYTSGSGGESRNDYILTANNRKGVELKSYLTDAGFGSDLPANDPRWVGLRENAGDFNEDMKVAIVNRSVFATGASDEGYKKFHAIVANAPDVGLILDQNHFAVASAKDGRITIFDMRDILPFGVTEIDWSTETVDGEIVSARMDGLNFFCCSNSRSPEVDTRQVDPREATMVFDEDSWTVGGIGLKGDKGEVELKLAEDQYTVQFSRALERFLIVGNTSIDIYDFDKTVRTGGLATGLIVSIPINAPDPWDVTGFFLPNDANRVIVADGSETVREFILPAGDVPLSSSAIVRSSSPITYAEPDGNGDRLLLHEDLGQSFFRQVLYSVAAQAEWLDLGTEYKWGKLAFYKDGTVIYGSGGEWSERYNFPNLTSLVEAARKSVSPSCMPDPDNPNPIDTGYMLSPCWPGRRL